MTTTIHSRRTLLSTALIGGAVIAVVIGLLTSQSLSTTPEGGINAWVVSEYDAAPSQTTYKIVPSPVIETNAEFFFGTGDGCAGYFSERPAQ